MTLPSRTLSAIALAAIGVAAALLGGAAPAEARSTGAHIFNLTGSELRIVEVETHSSDAGAPVWSKEDPTVLPPRKNQVVQPGEELHIEIENPAFHYRNAILRLAAPGVSFRIELANGEYPTCVSVSPPMRCDADGGRIALLEPPGSERVISSGDIQGQAKALKALCTDANDCEFEPLKTFPAETPTKVYGNTVTNCAAEGGPDVDTTISAKDTVETSNSVGVNIEVGFKFFKIFQAGITLKYKHERSESHEFKQDVHVTVQPGYVGWVDITAPVIRDVGDFTLKLGNTRWKLKNVAFDSPDPNPERSGNFTADYEKLTPEQYKAACPHKREALGAPGPLMTSAALVARANSGSTAADLMRGGPESNTMRGLAGHDLIRGGGGHDTLLGGAGRDLIKGGPGEDRINGGPGSDRIDDTSGPTEIRTGANRGPRADRVDVADGRGDDVVICDTPRTVVIVDPGDEVNGPCGRLSIRRPRG